MNANGTMHLFYSTGELYIYALVYINKICNEKDNYPLMLQGITINSRR